VWRSLLTYQSTRPPQDALRRRLRELAAVRVSYGYRRLHTVLRREGWPVNPKRIYRLYCAEELQLRRKRPRRRRSAVPRGPRRIASQPNEVWAMDFMHDTLADGRLVRVLTLIDSYTRESLALVAQPRFRGEDVALVLRAVGTQRGLPRWITVDNGTEFTSRALDAWAYWNHVQLDFSRPGKPGDNCLRGLQWLAATRVSLATLVCLDRRGSADSRPLADGLQHRTAASQLSQSPAG